jgi:hypothetical protein
MVPSAKENALGLRVGFRDVVDLEDFVPIVVDNLDRDAAGRRRIE